MPRMKPEIKAVLLSNNLWKPFCSARRGLQMDPELNSDPKALKARISVLLESHLRMCEGNEDLEIVKEVAPGKSHKKKEFSIRDVLTSEEIDEIRAKGEVSLNVAARWVSECFLRAPEDIDFTTAPDIGSISLYEAYRDDLGQFSKDILSKCMKADKNEGVERFDGENLACFCVELREMYSKSVLLAAEHERDLEDKRQEILHG